MNNDKPTADNSMDVYFTDRPMQTYNTISYNCQGGFFMIIESGVPGPSKMKTTCIPSSLIDHVVIQQNT